MQIQPILDIRESPWELSPEAQTHNKLLLTGTVCFLFLSIDLQFGAFVRAGEKEKNRILYKTKKLVHFCFFLNCSKF